MTPFIDIFPSIGTDMRYNTGYKHYTLLSRQNNDKIQKRSRQVSP